MATTENTEITTMTTTRPEFYGDAGKDLCRCGHVRDEHEAIAGSRWPEEGTCFVERCTCSHFRPPRVAGVRTLRHDDLLTVRGAHWPKVSVFTMSGYMGNDSGNGRRVALIPQAVVIHTGPCEREDRIEVAIGDVVRISGYGTWRIEHSRPAENNADHLALRPVDAVARRQLAAERHEPIRMSEAEMSS